MYKTVKPTSIFLALCALVFALPQDRSDPPGLDVKNPAGSDPKSPPKTLWSDPRSPPKGLTAPIRQEWHKNPFIVETPNQPKPCDGQNPSEDCLKAMDSSGGYLWFDNDSQCDENQRGMMGTAVWDSNTLALWSNDFPRNARAHAAGAYYMGPDYSTQQDRIAGNLRRVSEFKSPKTKSNYYITMSCKDTKNYCGKTITGKGVGGYAWTYKGWFFGYHYITFCPLFFTLPSLNEKIDEIEDDLTKGRTDRARDMEWLKSTGQFFLHEMMHTRIADGGEEPHIIDEYVVQPDKGDKPDVSMNKAYGPWFVRSLAERDILLGGGATRASTNADSYAILANANWWWDITGYFPGVPLKKKPGPPQLVSLHIDLDNSTDLTTADFTALFDAELKAFGDGPRELELPIVTVVPIESKGPSTAADVPPSTTASPPPPPPPTPALAPTCPLGMSAAVLGDKWPSCDKCPGGYNPDKCAASEASAVCKCKDPCGDIDCVRF